MIYGEEFTAHVDSNSNFNLLFQTLQCYFYNHKRLLLSLEPVTVSVIFLLEKEMDLH